LNRPSRPSIEGVRKAGDRAFFHIGLEESQSLQVGPETRLAARLAVYRDGEPGVRIEEIEGTGPRELIHRLSTRLEQLIRGEGSILPQAALQALVENLVHAGFRAVTVSVLAGGRLVRIADHGPGIADKRLALQPGYSSAGEAERSVVAGVGAGLATARALVEAVGGRLEIEDNLGGGTVVTISAGGSRAHDRKSDGAAAAPVSAPASAVAGAAPAAPPRAVLARSAVSDTGKRILLLVAELGGAGLPTICDELRIARPAAQLELEHLRRLALVDPHGGEQMTLTPAGLAYLDGIFSE
jgi:histidine kinase/DNA gyrase B/HSP90-like ATPase